MPRARRRPGLWPAWELTAGRLTRVSTPPRLGASTPSSRRPMSRRASLGPAEVEAEHAAAAGEPAPGALVSGMAGQPGVVDGGHGGVRLQTLRQEEGVAVLLLHPQGQGLEPALQQEAGVGIEHAAEVVHLVRDPPDPLRRGDDGAGDDVGVAVDGYLVALCNSTSKPASRGR